MNQYSSWKYILILLTIGLSLLYVTPNFYGESFAVQVMPVKAGETIDTSTLKLVESSLDKAKIQNHPQVYYFRLKGVFQLHELLQKVFENQQ